MREFIRNCWDIFNKRPKMTLILIVIVFVLVVIIFCISSSSNEVESKATVLPSSANASTTTTTSTTVRPKNGDLMNLFFYIKCNRLVFQRRQTFLMHRFPLKRPVIVVT